MNQITRLYNESGVTCIAAILTMLLVSVPMGAHGANNANKPDSPDSQVTSLSVEGISASIGEDNPRVLYILPWQAPSLPRRPRADLDSDAPQLIQPLNPLVLERHRTFRQTLNPLVLNPDKGLAVTVQ